MTTELKNDGQSQPVRFPPDIWGEQREWLDQPHEELVSAVRTYIQDWEQNYGTEFTPAELIARHLRLSGQPRDETIEALCSPVELTWDALAFDYYREGAYDSVRAREVLSDLRGANVEFIKLSDPLQIKVIEVLTEAMSIPYEKGQSEIKLPEIVQ
jgi:hypothetical protein